MIKIIKFYHQLTSFYFIYTEKTKYVFRSTSYISLLPIVPMKKISLTDEQMKHMKKDELLQQIKEEAVKVRQHLML